MSPEAGYSIYSIARFCWDRRGSGARWTKASASSFQGTAAGACARNPSAKCGASGAYGRGNAGM